MVRYLVLVKYSASGAAGARKDGFAVRQQEGAKAFLSAGAEIDSWMWLDWSDYDFGFTATAPDGAALANIANMSMATGAFSKIWCKEIFTSEEMDAAARPIEYRAPGA